MSDIKSPSILRKALRYILQKDPVTVSLIQQLSKKLKVDFSVVDANEKVLWGANTDFSIKHDLKENGEIFGIFLTNSAEAEQILAIINVLVKKELEKKKLGNEVLGLYREINMIYDLSEMISEKIDAKSIAQVALREASQIIDSTHGLILMYEADENKVVEMSSFGENPHQVENIKRQNKTLKEIILRGISSIVPSETIKVNPALNHLKAVMHAPLKVKHRTLGMIMLGHRESREFTAAELKLLTTIALQSASAIESAHLYQKGLKEARDREEAIRSIHEVSQKFVPSEFIKSLGKDKLTEVSLGDLVEREVTVLLADIRGFTALSEGLDPRDNFLFINSFNKRMGPIIRKNNGFIIQYLGDGFMALFPAGSQNALRASVQMHGELENYNNERIEKERTPVKIGIGMQDGKLIMGITGDAERLDAAIISDTVNTAARIEGLSKHFGTSILLTELCKNNLTHPQEFDFRYLGPVQVKGKQKPIKLYECFNGDESSLLQHKSDTLDIFDHGMKQYFEKEFAMAAVTFQKIVKMNPKDHTAKLFLNRSAHLITQEIGDDWKGVESIGAK
jgi:class 3 adenylate cyclase